MNVLNNFDGWPKGDLHVAIGVFDGVHLGHQALVARTRESAHAAGGLALVATFDPPPMRVFAPDSTPLDLTTLDERIALLHEAGADAVAVFTFDSTFAKLSAHEFAARFAGAGTIRHVIVGPDFHFGHRREGATDTLRQHGVELGFSLEVVPPVTLGGEVISSTRIRELLVAGDLPGAATLLGRNHSITGRVVHGDRRGTALGFPTLNLEPNPEILLPCDGIYAMWVDIGGHRHPAAASLGVRPTFGSNLDRRLETYLLDFSGDVYGETATATFVERLRSEERFDSPEALTAQIAKDVENTRRILSA